LRNRLTSGNLQALQIVTADGTIRTCNATRSSDLFWACRGGGRLSRVPSFANSDFFTRRIPTAGIHELVAGIERMRGVRGAAGGVGAIAFDAFGGALNRVQATATAFVHRNSLFLAP
jgi:hypothetical protein